MTHDQSSDTKPLRSVADLAADALPEGAPTEWLDTAISVVGMHPKAPAALRHAFDAGVNPRDLASIQLSHWTGQAGLPLPVLSFGPKAEEPCRRFGCDGEIAPQPVFGPWSTEQAAAAAWVMRLREAGAHFQWMSRGEEVVWIGMPVEQIGDVQSLHEPLSLTERLAVVAVVKPILRANGGFF
ncbi:hypothetical protein [Brevundimonas nasdae]|uniref:hypothetical protein n=1 Tax=Brevundimonas nasdae TaxID=172043 RepID=UPI00301A17C1